jgi:hypothetical protein
MRARRHFAKYHARIKYPAEQKIQKKVSKFRLKMWRTTSEMLPMAERGGGGS